MPSDVLEVLAVLASAYPNFKLTDQTIAIYRRLLADLPVDLLQAATLTCATECKFFPTIAEIRQAAAQLTKQASDVPSPSEAWEEVLHAIRDYGYYRTPEWKHEIVGKVAMRFGWRDLCLSENIIADRARFLQAYELQLGEDTRAAVQLPEVKRFVDNNRAAPMLQDLTRKLTHDQKID